MKIKIPLIFELTEDQFEELVKQTKLINEKFGQDLTPQELLWWIMMVDDNFEFLVASTMRRMERLLKVEFSVRKERTCE